MSIFKRIISSGLLFLSLLSPTSALAQGGFLGGNAPVSPPDAVLEATGDHQLNLSFANFSLGLMGLLSTFEVSYGLVTMDAYHISSGARKATRILLGYAVVNTVLSNQY